MSCEVQKIATAVALGNAVVSTPGVALGVVAPPAELALLARMWLSWFALLVAMKFLHECLEASGNNQDAGSVKREIDKLRREMDEIKRRCTP